MMLEFDDGERSPLLGLILGGIDEECWSSVPACVFSGDLSAFSECS